ncbi:MAG: hypothetical protein AAGF49_00825 [Pseudomonadota bacterium]
MFKRRIVAVSTALAVAVTSLTAPATANAAPYSAFKTSHIETGATAVEQVQRRRIRRRRVYRGRRYRGRRYNPGAAAAAGIIGLAAGAIIAGGAAARPRCRVVRVRRWSPRYQAYVVHRRRVC